MTLAPVLVVVTDTSLAPRPVLLARIERVASLSRAGTMMVQLREHALSVRERRKLGESLLAICRRHGQWLSVNDRVDLALVLGADGVHLGERSVTPLDARKLVPGAFVSHACHDREHAFVAGSDAAMLSPIVLPRKGRPALGVGALTRARKILDEGARAAGVVAPALYALGGVDASTARACLDHGAQGVAVIGAVLDGRDPAPLIRALGIER